jgi:hypothetical protein
VSPLFRFGTCHFRQSPISLMISELRSVGRIVGHEGLLDATA